MDGSRAWTGDNWLRELKIELDIKYFSQSMLDGECSVRIECSERRNHRGKKLMRGCGGRREQRRTRRMSKTRASKK